MLDTFKIDVKTPKAFYYLSFTKNKLFDKKCFVILQSIKYI